MLFLFFSIRIQLLLILGFCYKRFKSTVANRACPFLNEIMTVLLMSNSLLLTFLNTLCGFFKVISNCLPGEHLEIVIVNQNQFLILSLAMIVYQDSSIVQDQQQQ